MTYKFSRMDAYVHKLKTDIVRELEFRRMQKKYRDQVVDSCGDLRPSGGRCCSARGVESGADERSPDIRALMEAIAREKKTWSGSELSFFQQTYERQKPLRFLRLQIELLKLVGGTTVVEIGSARTKLRHAIDAFNPVCCNDGHSTYHWASTPTADVHTVDISPRAKQILDRAGFSNLHAYTGDAIAFLRIWKGPSIDLLFLDAWDVGVSEYAEKHRQAFGAARSKLSSRHVIGIDDTDIAGGGKGKLLVPHLTANGYTMLVDGRQTVLVNFDV